MMWTSNNMMWTSATTREPKPGTCETCPRYDEWACGIKGRCRLTGYVVLRGHSCDEHPDKHRAELAVEEARHE